MNVMKYKGYTGTIEYSEEDDCLFGKLLGINDSISYDGESVKELRENFQGMLDFYLDSCKEAGKEPNKPYSGRFALRINPDMHAKLAIQAQVHGKSLNQYASDILAQA